MCRSVPGCVVLLAGAAIGCAANHARRRRPTAFDTGGYANEIAVPNPELLFYHFKGVDSCTDSVRS